MKRRNQRDWKVMYAISIACIILGAAFIVGVVEIGGSGLSESTQQTIYILLGLLAAILGLPLVLVHKPRW